MQIIADLHTHTNVTDHAFSTLTEMVQAAETAVLRLSPSPTTAPPIQTARTSGISPTWTLSRARLAR